MEMQHDPSTVDPDAALRHRAQQSLHVGFLVSIVLILAGVLLSAIRQEAFPDTLGTPLDSIRGALDGDAAGIIGLGILAMILTPLVTAAVVAWRFLQEGDRRYAAISGVVVVILLVSMLVASL
jgi:uncharacterized membrane protein